MNWEQNRLMYDLGDGGHFQRGKVQVACLDGEETEKEWRGIMVWSK